MASIIADAGFQTAIVREINMKPSGSGKSINYWAEFELTGQESKFKGKIIKCCFNTETQPPGSYLNGAQFRPSSDILVLAAAVEGIDPKDVPESYDTDKMLLRNFDLQVTIDVSTGIPSNGTGLFLPAGRGISSSRVPF